MIVEYTRTGGIAGIKIKNTIDTNKLPPKTANELTNLIDTIQTGCPRKGPDRFRYVVNVDGHVFSFGEGVNRRLTEILNDLARSHI